MYEIGTTDTVNHFIDSLLNDWSKVVYLYNLVHDFAEHLKNGKRIEDCKKAAVEYLNASFSPTPYFVLFTTFQQTQIYKIQLPLDRIHTRTF